MCKLCILIFAILLAGGCNGGPPPLNLPPGAMVLRLADVDDIPTLDPAAGYDTLSWTYEQAIFDTLVRYGDGNVELERDIAEKWESSPDSKAFTFHLRRDARFSNGRAVTSEDFRFGVERVLNPATRSKGMEYYRGIEGSADFIAHRSTHVSGIETPDAWTIVFRLSAPDPIFAHKLAMPFASAVPHEAVERWGEDFARHVVGSGAFMLKQWLAGQRLVLVRNPFYFARPLPRLDAIIQAVGVNPELQWLQYEAGQVDAITEIPPAEFPYIMKSPELRALTLHKTTVTTRYLGMNCQMWPFTDVRVRRAISYGIDRRKLIALMNGRGVVAHSPLPPDLPGFNPHVTGYDHDPAKARALLEEAHLSAGFSFEIWMRAAQTVLMLGESIQQDLAQLGIRVELKPVAWGPLLEAIRQPHTAQSFVYGWEADFPDPENFLGALLSRSQWGSNNDSFYFNPAFQKLIDEAARQTNLEKRYALYGEAEKIVIDDAPWVFLFYPVTYVIRQPWVHDYVINPMRPTRFERVWVSPHRQ
jgi:ABC-type transport system substrate-binding protein